MTGNEIATRVITHYGKRRTTLHLIDMYFKDLNYDARKEHG